MRKIGWEDHAKYWHNCQVMLQEERQDKCSNPNLVDEFIRDVKCVRRRIEILRNKKSTDPLQNWVEFKEYSESVKAKLNEFFAELE